LICEAAREHVTVCLSGDGGDEIFGGYDRYRALNLAQNMPMHRYLACRFLGWAAGCVAPKNERNRLRRFARFAAALPYPFAMQYFTYRALFSSADLERLLSTQFQTGVDVDSPCNNFVKLYEDFDCEDEITRAQMHDLQTYLPDDLLVKTDIASMASSLELRSPLLDHDLVDFGLSLPVQAKVSSRQGKMLLRSDFADFLPPEVFAGPKRGFAVPLAGWLRGELRGVLQETLLDDSIARLDIFNPESIHGLVNDHLSGKDDHAHRLWALLILCRWLKQN
jgi:asparagine synthase (glutamine-hydrolysing)